MRERARAGLGLAFFIALILVAPPAAAILNASDSATALPGSALTLRLGTACTQVMSLDPVTIRAILTASGLGIPGARLNASSTPAGTFSPAEDLGNGQYALLWTAPRVAGPTYAMIKVRASADGYADVQTFLVVLVNPIPYTDTYPAPVFLRAIPLPTQVRAGESLILTMYAFTIQGYRIADMLMDARLMNATHGSVTPVVQKGCGYVLTFTASDDLPTETAILIRIVASKLGYRSVVLTIGLMVIA